MFSAHTYTPDKRDQKVKRKLTTRDIKIFRRKKKLSGQQEYQGKGLLKKLIAKLD